MKKVCLLFSAFLLVAAVAQAGIAISTEIGSGADAYVANDTSDRKSVV